MKRVHCCFLVNSTLNTKHEVVCFVIKSVILLQHRCTSLSAFSSRLNTMFQLISPFILNLLKKNMFNFTNTAKFPRKSPDFLKKKLDFVSLSQEKLAPHDRNPFLCPFVFTLTTDAESRDRRKGHAEFLLVT